MKRTWPRIYIYIYIYIECKETLGKKTSHVNTCTKEEKAVSVKSLVGAVCCCLWGYEDLSNLFSHPMGGGSGLDRLV